MGKGPPLTYLDVAIMTVLVVKSQAIFYSPPKGLSDFIFQK